MDSEGTAAHCKTCRKGNTRITPPRVTTETRRKDSGRYKARRARLLSDLCRPSREIKRLLAEVATLEAVRDHKDSKVKPGKRDSAPEGGDTDALRKRVIAAKIDRIASYGPAAPCAEEG